MYKVTNKDSVNRDYQLKEGLNTVSDFDMNKSNQCTRGLYFCRSKADALFWAVNLKYDHVYDVTLPKDATIIDYPTKSRTDRLILTNKRHIRDFINSMSSTEYLALVKHDGYAIKYLTDSQRTSDVCLATVQTNGSAIQYLTDSQRTSDVCLAAVQENGYAIQYLTDSQRTSEVCLAAVQQNGYAIKHLTDSQRTSEVCLAALQQNGHAIKFLTDSQRTQRLSSF